MGRERLFLDRLLFASYQGKHQAEKQKWFHGDQFHTKVGPQGGAGIVKLRQSVVKERQFTGRMVGFST